MNNLFSADLSKMNSKEISNWIIECRHAIKRDDYTNSETYYIELKKFCDEWEEHYNRYEKQYKSEKFEKAILSLALIKPKYVVNFGSGKETIEQNIFYDMISFMNTQLEFNKFKHNDFICYCELYSETYSTEEHKLSFFNSEDYKPMFVYALQSILGSKRQYEIRVLKDKKQYKTSTYKQLMKDIEKDSELKIKIVQRDICNSYFKELEKYGVRSTAFSEFINPFQEQKHFEKPMFINLCFATGMTLSLSERFLQYNGFSIKNSTREFDIICEKSLRLGFGRGYAKALIEKYNFEHRNQPSYKEIKNL